jgi:hypothetical protein
LKLVAEKEKKSTNLKTPLKINKSTSKESSTPLAFSELNWGQYTTDYHLSIVKHSPKYTTDTIAMACQFVKDLASDASTKGSLADDSVASSRGERALLCEYLFDFVLRLIDVFHQNISSIMSFCNRLHSPSRAYYYAHIHILINPRKCPCYRLFFTFFLPFTHLIIHLFYFFLTISRF